MDAKARGIKSHPSPPDPWIPAGSLDPTKAVLRLGASNKDTTFCVFRTCGKHFASELDFLGTIDLLGRVFGGAWASTVRPSDVVRCHWIHNMLLALLWLRSDCSPTVGDVLG